MNNIEDICNLFDADFSKTKRGYLRRGGIPHPTNNNIHIWWPSEKKRQGWVNRLSKDESIITETHDDMDKRSKYFEDNKNTEHKRIVFFHHKMY